MAAVDAIGDRHAQLAVGIDQMQRVVEAPLAVASHRSLKTAELDRWETPKVLKPYRHTARLCTTSWHKATASAVVEKSTLSGVSVGQ